ncbi:MAG: hypothetical protein ABIG85_03320 [Chloroflexota bacterium]
MGLFFVGEQARKPVELPAPTRAQIEATLDDLAEKRASVWSHTGDPRVTDELLATVRRVEPELIAAVASGAVRDVAAAVPWVEARVPATFPAARFVAIMSARAGGASKFVDACKAEAGVSVAAVGGGK